ncbi:MAG: TolC family protein [Deltaproteobacteria bacterium]|nr:TolC family protein [Deltaproteobacteria bacterium]
MKKRKMDIHSITLTIFILCSFLFVGVVSADEEDAKVFTLQESIQTALINNSSIKAKEEKIQEALYGEEKAKADFYPKLSTIYGYTRLDEVKRSPGTVSTITIPGLPQGTIRSSARDMNSLDNYQWKSTISQTLFAGYAVVSAHELAKLGIDSAKIDLELEKLNLVLDVKEAYFNILKAEKGMDVAEKAVALLESQVDVSRNFYEVGMIPVNDLLKAEVELANTRHNYIKAQNAVKLSYSAFNMLLSLPIDSPVKVEDILVFSPETPNLEQYMEKALDSRPEIQALDLNVLQVDQQIRLAKSKYYPAVSFTYDYIKAGDDPSVSGSDFHDDESWQAMIGMSWTLWDWGKRRSSVREAESLKRQLVHTRKVLENGIRLDIKRAILNLEQAEQNIPTAKKAVEQAEENLRVSQERYKAQVTTSTEVLDAQTLLSQARTNYYSALYDHNLAKAALLRAMGEY